MQAERGQLVGDQVIASAVELLGSIVGNVTVVDGGKLYVRGSVYGDLTVETGGRVHIFGSVSGSLIIKEGAKVIHSGVVGRNITNDGGRLFVETNAKVLGKLKTLRGESTIDPKSQVRID